MSNAVIIEQSGPNMIVRFNRPEIRSPLSIKVLERLSVIVRELQNGYAIERLIFTGVDDVFASGADLREIAEISGNGAREFALRGQNLMTSISHLQCATIAAVNGICFGGALDLALACDHRIGSPDALFAHPGADLGILTGWGGTQRLRRLVGEALALEMFFTAKRVSAPEALRMGLLDEISEVPLSRSVELDLQR